MRFLAVAALGLVSLALLAAERWRPLRPRVKPDGLHVGRNLAVAGIGGAATALAELALGWPAARAGRGRGLLRVLPLPGWLRALLGFLLPGRERGRGAP